MTSTQVQFMDLVKKHTVLFVNKQEGIDSVGELHEKISDIISTPVCDKKCGPIANAALPDVIAAYVLLMFSIANHCTVSTTCHMFSLLDTLKISDCLTLSMCVINKDNLPQISDMSLKLKMVLEVLGLCTKDTPKRSRDTDDIDGPVLHKFKLSEADTVVEASSEADTVVEASSEADTVVEASSEADTVVEASSE